VEDVDEPALAEVYNVNDNKESLDIGDEAVCVAIPKNMTLCRGIGYTQMRLPNLLHHSTLDEVSGQASSWSPLLTTHCHPDVQLYLCSLFSPVCLDQPIWPCRSLCERVRAGCEPTLRRFGYTWPEMFNCATLPPNEDLCIAPPQVTGNGSVATNRSENSTTTCSACQNSVSVEDLQKSFCTADFAAKVKLEDVVVNGLELKITASKKVKFYKQPSDFKPTKKRQEFYLQKSAECECRDLEFRSAGAASHFILMGKLDPSTGRLNVSFAYNYNALSDTTRKAMRSVLRSNTCSEASSSSNTKVVPSIGKVVPHRGGIKFKKNIKAERLNKKQEKQERKLMKMKRQEMKEKKILRDDKNEDDAETADRKISKGKKFERKNVNENGMHTNNYNKEKRNRKNKRVHKKIKASNESD